jgi:purine-cytosine permease-like protein
VTDDDKIKEIPKIFSALYFADVATTLVSLFMWSDFDLKMNNPYFSGFINSILVWIILKILIYLVIIYGYSYFSKYSSYADTVMIAIVVTYAMILLNDIAFITVKIPTFTISPELYQSLEAQREFSFRL